MKKLDTYLSNPIAVAILPLKTDAIQKAEQDERKFLELTLSKIASHDWNINAYAPYPDAFKMGREEYKMAMSKHNFAKYITQERPGQDEYKLLGFRAKRTAPLFVEEDKLSIEKHIEITKESAALQYDQFVCKMIRKIGEVSEATITGSHVWGYSYLTVITSAGEKQVWKTQQIVNRSVYNKLFNQYPSRKMKGASV